jgi:hypothetical protein
VGQSTSAAIANQIYGNLFKPALSDTANYTPSTGGDQASAPSPLLTTRSTTMPAAPPPPSTRPQPLPRACTE